MNFFSRSNTTNPVSLLSRIQDLYDHDERFNFDNNSKLVKQINTIERNLKYFKKQYPELNHNLNLFESCYLRTFDDQYPSLTLQKELKEYTREIGLKVQASTDGYHDAYGFAIPMLGMGLISFGVGLDMLMSGISIAAAGGPIGWIIGGAILLTLALGFLAVGIGTVVNIALANEKYDKYNELCNIIDEQLGLNDPSPVESVDSVKSTEDSSLMPS